MEIRVGHPVLPMLLATVSCEAWPSVRFLELTQYPRCLQSKKVGYNKNKRKDAMIVWASFEGSASH